MGKRGFRRRSCDACHRRKVRCDSTEIQKQCTSCHRRGEACAFTEPASLQTPKDPTVPTSIYLDPTLWAHSSASSLVCETLSAPQPSASLPTHDFDFSTDSQQNLTTFPSTLQSNSFEGSVHLNDVDYMSLINEYLQIRPSLCNQQTISSLGMTKEEEEEALRSFCCRRSIVTDIILTCSDPRQWSKVETLSPWREVMERAVICSGMVGSSSSVDDRLHAKAQSVLETINRQLSENKVPLEIETLCALIVMSEVWPSLILGDEDNTSPLSIDVRSVEGLCRVWLTFSRRASSQSTVPPEWVLVHWYIYLLDAMQAADQGRSPYLNWAPSRGALIGAYDESIAKMASELASLGREIGNLVENSQSAVDSSALRGLLRKLGAVGYDTILDTTNPADDSKPGRLVCLLRTLRGHCFLSLNECLASVEPSPTDVVGYSIRRMLETSAMAAWSEIIADLETRQKISPDSILVSSATVEIGIGCLFWGISQTKKSLHANRWNDVICFLSGSKSLLDILECHVSHRLDLSTKLQTMKTELLRLTN